MNKNNKGAHCSIGTHIFIYHLGDRECDDLIDLCMSVMWLYVPLSWNDTPEWNGQIEC